MKRIALLKRKLRNDIIRALDAGGVYPANRVETWRGAFVRFVVRDRAAPAGLRVRTELPDLVTEAFGGANFVPMVSELTHEDTIDETLATADLCAILDAIAPLADDVDAWPEPAAEALGHFVRAVEVTGGILRGDGAPVGDPEWPDLGDAYVRACLALGVPVCVSADDNWCDQCAGQVRINSDGTANHVTADGNVAYDTDADHTPTTALWERLVDGTIPDINWDHQT